MLLINIFKSILILNYKFKNLIKTDAELSVFNVICNSVVIMLLCFTVDNTSI